MCLTFCTSMYCGGPVSPAAGAAKLPELPNLPSGQFVFRTNTERKISWPLCVSGNPPRRSQRFQGCQTARKSCSKVHRRQIPCLFGCLVVLLMPARGSKAANWPGNLFAKITGERFPDSYISGRSPEAQQGKSEAPKWQGMSFRHFMGERSPCHFGCLAALRNAFSNPKAAK